MCEIRIYDREGFVCTAIDEDHSTLRLSLRDLETARRARRRALRRDINERFPTVPHRSDPLPPIPTPHRPPLYTYEEDKP